MITSRREFLEGMGWMVPLASGLPAVSQARPVASVVNSTAAPASFHSILIDGQYAQARNLGAHFAGSGAAVHVTDGEITDLWLREIQPAWKRKPVAIAGLTGSSTLFCLEQLAWTHGLRVVFHAEHVLLDSQEAVHSVHTHDAALAPVDNRVLAAAGANWSARVADVFDSYHQNLPIIAAGPSCAGLEPAIPPGASLLTSWIIAPA